jgi:hypothetical protein
VLAVPVVVPVLVPVVLVPVVLVPVVLVDVPVVALPLFALPVLLVSLVPQPLQMKATATKVKSPRSRLIYFPLIFTSIHDSARACRAALKLLDCETLRDSDRAALHSVVITIVASQVIHHCLLLFLTSHACEQTFSQVAGRPAT